jgi:hypothetical protein
MNLMISMEKTLVLAKGNTCTNMDAILRAVNNVHYCEFAFSTCARTGYALI